MRRSTLASFILASAALMASPRVFAQAESPAVEIAHPEIPTSDVPQLVSTLNDAASKQDLRDQAARRLLARPSAEAREAIRVALSNPQSAIQLAALRALCDRPQDDPALVAPLFALLDPNATKPVIDCAAHALTVYKNDPQVLDRLINLTKNAPDERLRQAAIRAVGTFAEKRAAQTLIDLLDPTAQPPSINSVAADALNYMSGQSFGADTEPWRKWFTGQKDKSDADFRADILGARSVRFDASAQSLNELKGEMVRLLNDQYQSTPREGRADLLLRRLKSPSPMVRQVGAQVVTESALTDPTPQVIKEQLRSMIGDSAAPVRKQVADALALINDADALSPLLTQLSQESDSSVRAAIAAALRPIADVRSVTHLLHLLDDPSVETATIAATALGEPGMGQKILSTDPTLARLTAQKLTEVLTRRTGAQSNVELREQLVRGLTELKQRSTMQLMMKMLASPAETPRVKRSLLDAVGALQDPQVAATIVGMLDDADPTIRVSALAALGECAENFDYGPRVQKLLDDTNLAVREAAWNTFKKLVAKAPDQQLPLIVDRFSRDPARRIFVLNELARRARARGDQDELAVRLQQMGDATVEDKRPDDALAAYQEALAIREKGSTPADVRYIEPLSESILLAQLQSKRYREAVEFTRDKIRQGSQFEGILPPKLCNEAERLFQTSDYESTATLVTAALKMDPPLRPQFTQRLEQLQNELIARQKKQNTAPLDPVMQMARTS